MGEPSVGVSADRKRASAILRAVSQRRCQPIRRPRLGGQSPGPTAGFGATGAARRTSPRTGCHVCATPATASGRPAEGSSRPGRFVFRGPTREPRTADKHSPTGKTHRRGRSGQGGHARWSSRHKGHMVCGDGCFDPLFPVPSWPVRRSTGDGAAGYRGPRGQHAHEESLVRRPRHQHRVLLVVQRHSGAGMGVELGTAGSAGCPDGVPPAGRLMAPAPPM
jgi:hypothetical protein